MFFLMLLLQKKVAIYNKTFETYIDIQVEVASFFSDRSHRTGKFSQVSHGAARAAK